MFFVLDTDHTSALEWGSGGAGQRLMARLNALPVGEAATTIIKFEEQTRGWLSVLARSRSLEEQVEAYRRLKRLPGNYLTIEVLDFDAPAAAEFERLQGLRLRVGTMDFEDRGDRARSQCNCAYAKRQGLRPSAWVAR